MCGVFFVFYMLYLLFHFHIPFCESSTFQLLQLGELSLLQVSFTTGDTTALNRGNNLIPHKLQPHISVSFRARNNRW